MVYGLDNYNFNQIFSTFTEETGIELSVKHFENNELKSALLQSANMQQLPDVVIVPSDFVGLTELAFSTIPATWLHKETSEQSLQTALLHGEYKGIPIIHGNHLLLFYNKTLIKNPAKSWNELRQQEKLLSKNQTLIGWNYFEMYWFTPFLGAFGDFPYVDFKLNMNTKGMAEALAWYRSFSDTGLINRECDYTCNQTSFIDGNQAYIINGSWAFNQYSDELGENLGVALLPTYNGKAMRPYYSSHVIAFPNSSVSSKKQALLNRFALFMQSQKAQQSIWQQMRSLPTNTVVSNQILKGASPNLKVILKQLEQSEPMPIDRNMAVVWEAMLKGTNRYLADIFDNVKAAEYMQYIAERSIEHDSK